MLHTTKCYVYETLFSSKTLIKPLLQLKKLSDSQKIVISVNNGPWKLFLQELLPQFYLVVFFAGDCFSSLTIHFLQAYTTP
jgi:hypothetical protein